MRLGSSKGRARNCREAGRGAPDPCGFVKPIGTAIAGAPVGGEICGELFPARVTRYIAESMLAVTKSMRVSDQVDFEQKHLTTYQQVSLTHFCKSIVQIYKGGEKGEHGVCLRDQGQACL